MQREYSIGELKKLGGDLERMARKTEQATTTILDDLAATGLEEMKHTYNSQPYQIENDSQMNFSITQGRKKRTITMEGSQAVYREFGTGTMGQQNPHPIKGEFALDDYNSHVTPKGTIRYATKKDNAISGIPVGELFWTYKDEKGQTHYTQGVPAGKEGYNASRKIRKDAAKIIRKRIKEALV